MSSSKRLKHSSACWACCRQVDGVDMTGGEQGHPVMSSAFQRFPLAGSATHAAKSPHQCHPTTHALSSVWGCPMHCNDIPQKNTSIATLVTHGHHIFWCFCIDLKHQLDIYLIWWTLKCCDARILVTYGRWCSFRLSVEDKLQEGDDTLTRQKTLKNAVC